MGEPGEITVPFRWDLVSPDQLGSLLEEAGEPDLWFLDSLVACTGKVLARSGDGDLFFVGRSKRSRPRPCHAQVITTRMYADR